jgi:predicted nucleic acid-binding protein
MRLVDTSVWIDHFRRPVPSLAKALSRQMVLTHSVVIGELATGNLRNRPRTLADLRSLPRTRETRFEECLHFIETHRLFGKGLGWDDVQLLASAMLDSVPLWSTDKRLHDTAAALGLAFKER